MLIENFKNADFQWRVCKYEDCFGYHSYAEIYYKPWGKWIGKIYNFSNIQKQYVRMVKMIEEGYIRK